MEVDVEGKGEKVTTILYFGRKANYPLCPVNPATPHVRLKENSKPGALVRCWPGIKTNLSSKLLDSKLRAETFLLFANVVKVFEVVQVPCRPPCLDGMMAMLVTIGNYSFKRS